MGAGSDSSPRVLSARPRGWRRSMRRELAWILVVKLLALLALWSLFFSPAHRIRVDGTATSCRFALANACSSGESP